MRTLIVLNGELGSATYLKKLSLDFDYIICADGGYDNAIKADITPNILLGDLDSCKSSDFNGERITFPAEKDKTDGELAIEEAFLRGADEVVLTCALGGRYDHMLANLYLLLKYNNVYISEHNQSIYYINDLFKISDKQGATASLIPIYDSVVSVTGFKYETENAKFYRGSTLGMSNIIYDNHATIDVKSGGLFLFINE